MDNQVKVDMMMPSDTNTALISSSTQLNKQFVNKGAKCMVLIFSIITFASIVTQIVFLGSSNHELHIAAAYMSIGIASILLLTIWGALYNPVSTDIAISKSNNMITVTYKMMLCGRLMERQESLSNVQDMVVSPVKSQYGIVGYVANIYFKDGAKKIQLYKDRQDSDIIQDFEEISMFIMGKNAQNNELKGDCDCSKGGCYCVCCKNWVLVTIVFIIIAAAYIGGSFSLAISQNCGSFLESNC